MATLTPRQRRILRLACGHYRDRGYGITLREAAKVGGCSLSTAFYNAGVLRDLGMLVDAGGPDGKKATRSIIPTLVGFEVARVAPNGDPADDLRAARARVRALEEVLGEVLTTHMARLGMDDRGALAAASALALLEEREA